MALVSVVMPVYNAEQTILETVRSVQAQTVADFELIIINDGSCDRTLDLLSTLSDPRIKVFTYENAGVSTARNRGIQHATAELIAFIDADDLWTPDKLEAQIKALQSKPEAAFAYSWTYYLDIDYLDTEGELLQAHPAEPVYFEGNIYPQLLLRNFIASTGSNLMVRQWAIAQIGGFDPQYTIGEDWEFSLRLAKQFPGVVVPQHQVYYRRTPTSATANIRQIRAETLHLFHGIYQAAPPELQRQKRKTLSWMYQYLTDSCLRNGQGLTEVQAGGWYLLKAIYLSPEILMCPHTYRLLRWCLKRWIAMQFANFKHGTLHPSLQVID